jgi:hypothetical protein
VRKYFIAQERDGTYLQQTIQEEAAKEQGVGGREEVLGRREGVSGGSIGRERVLDVCIVCNCYIYSIFIFKNLTLINTS